MPQRVPLIGVTVIREGKRVTPKIGVPFSLPGDELTAVTAVHKTAFRKPVNESGDPAPSREDSPEHRRQATADLDPNRPDAEEAARRDSDEGAEAAERAPAKAGETKPKSTKAAAKAKPAATEEDDDI